MSHYCPLFSGPWDPFCRGTCSAKHQTTSHQHQKFPKLENGIKWILPKRQQSELCNTSKKPIAQNSYKSTTLLTSNLSKAHETRDSLAVTVRRLSWSIFNSPSISLQFTLKICTRAKNWKKTLKPPILGVQSHLRSLMLTPLKSL